MVSFLLRGHAQSNPILSYIDNCSLIAALLISVSGCVGMRAASARAARAPRNCDARPAPHLPRSALVSISSWLPSSAPAWLARFAVHMAVWSFLFCLFVLCICVTYRVSLSIVSNLVIHNVNKEVEDTARADAMLQELRRFPVYGLPMLMLLMAIAFLISWLFCLVSFQLPFDYVWVIAWAITFTLGAFSVVFVRYLRHYFEVRIHDEHLAELKAWRAQKAAAGAPIKSE